MLAKNRTNFSHPFSFCIFIWGDPCRIYRKSFTVPETRVFHSADGEDLMILACTVFDWSTRVTDGRTDRIAMAKMRWKQKLLLRVKM